MQQQNNNNININQYDFELVNANIEKLNDDIKKLSNILNIKDQYDSLIKNEHLEIKDLNDKNKISQSDSKKIKQFYFNIASLSDEKFKEICEKNELETKDLFIWKKITEAYFIENAHKTVVPKTPINIARKVNSWSNCIEGNGTGIHLIYKDQLPIGFFGVTKMDKENEFEVNYVVFKIFKEKI